MPAEKKEATENEQTHAHEVVTLLEWKAPGRPFRKRTKQFYLTAILIMLLVEIILFLFSEYVLMAVVVALVFVSFALATIPPRDFNYKISSEGIMIEDKFFLWQELYDFYFKKAEGINTVRVRTQSYFPGELTLTLGNEDEGKIKQAILPYLPFREYIKPTFTEKSADWLAKNFPLEKN